MSTEKEVVGEGIAAGGDGVARADGLVVFIPRSAPGDVAGVRITPRGAFARGELVALRTPSPDRVTPPCLHYTRDRCGGCQLQHLAYQAQCASKGTIIRDALQRIGKRTVVPTEVRPSPSPWRYRRKLTLAMRRRPDGWTAGLHAYDAPGRVFRLQDCPITDGRVIAVWHDILRAAEHLPDARELRGAVRLTETGATFVLEGGRSWPHSAELFAAVPSLIALWWEDRPGRRRLLHRRTDEHAPGASFAQVNVEVAAALGGYVVERAMSFAPGTAVDAYAGLGDTAAALASRGVRVTAIESDADAAAWCTRRLPAGSRCLAALTEEVLAAALPADVVILNPPRSGIDASVAATLESVEHAPQAVIYVSCNPATLARDLVRLPRYRINSLLGFDMFPQTAHVETVCELVPERE